MIDAKKLAEKVRLGNLTQEEFDLIVDTVRDGPHDEDLFILIRILGVIGTSELKELIAKFLFYPSDPYVSKTALETLCRELGLTSNYLDEIKKFIQGEPWDVNDDIRLSAMGIAGDYLSENFDQELLKLLWDVFDKLGTDPRLHETRDYARNFIKACAYGAIAKTMKSDYDEISAGEKTEEWITNKEFYKLDQVMLQTVRELINQ